MKTWWATGLTGNPRILTSRITGITRGRLGHYQISVSVRLIISLSAEWITHFLLSITSNKDKYLMQISTENQLVATGKSENVSQMQLQHILYWMSPYSKWIAWFNLNKHKMTPASNFGKPQAVLCRGHNQDRALINTHALVGILLLSCALWRLRLPTFKVSQLNTRNVKCILNTTY